MKDKAMKAKKNFTLLLHSSDHKFGCATEHGYIWKDSIKSLRKAMQFVFDSEIVFTDRRLSDGKPERLLHDLSFNGKAKADDFDPEFESTARTF